MLCPVARPLEFYSDEWFLFSLNNAVTMNPTLMRIIPHSGRVGASSQRGSQPPSFPGGDVNWRVLGALLFDELGSTVSVNAVTDIEKLPVLSGVMLIDVCFDAPLVI